MKMEKKQGFFCALKEELVRGLSPLISLARKSSSHRRMITNHVQIIPQKSSSLKPVLAPLLEGPDQDQLGVSSQKSKWFVVVEWMKGQFSGDSGNSKKRSDMRLLLGVMATALAPVHVSIDPLPHLTIKDTPIETSSAQYILQQYTAASGGQKLLNSIRNTYALGKLKMVALEFEAATKIVKSGNIAKAAKTGGFVLWQMNQDLWYVEVAIGDSKVRAGCNGKLVWRHTPWLGAHAAKGPVRPLRRALQGLDPRIIANIFVDARCTGEKEINGEHCFILKLSTDPQALKAMSEEPTEIIRHVIFGYFSQKTGLLVYIEDSHLTRIQYDGSDALYCETRINSFLEDYRPVDGILIAHYGRSVLTLYRFGEIAVNHTKARMEEAWSIEEVAFNVPGLSMDCFIPPADLRADSIRVLAHNDNARNTAMPHSAPMDQGVYT